MQQKPADTRKWCEIISKNFYLRIFKEWNRFLVRYTVYHPITPHIIIHDEGVDISLQMASIQLHWWSNWTAAPIDRYHVETSGIHINALEAGGFKVGGTVFVVHRSQDQE